jgi:hypothetical protein
MTYTPLRYARVGEANSSGDRVRPVEWVVLGRWDLSSGTVQFGVELSDDRAGDAGG